MILFQRIFFLTHQKHKKFGWQHFAFNFYTIHSNCPVASQNKNKFPSIFSGSLWQLIVDFKFELNIQYELNPLCIRKIIHSPVVLVVFCYNSYCNTDYKKAAINVSCLAIESNTFLRNPLQSAICLCWSELFRFWWLYTNLSLKILCSWV